jgi:aminopeptidase N
MTANSNIERILCHRLDLDNENTAHGHALPGDTAKWPRDRAVDLRHLKLDLWLNTDTKQVGGTATHTVAPYTDGLASVPFDAADMVIESVAVDGKAAVHDYDGAVLRVSLPPGRKRGSEVKVAIAYRATPRLGLYFIAPDTAYPDKPVQVWSQGQDEDSKHWFPCYDSPNDKATTELIVTVPGDWFALSNGRLLEEKKNRNGTKRFHWYQDRPHATYLITLAAGKFARIDGSRNGLTIDYFVEEKDVERGQMTFANTPDMIALFERVTGIAYPWAKYSQIVVRDFVFGGMENTSATTMVEEILVDRKASRDFTSDDLISHELAHMWWGDLLTCRDWSHSWLNEGFATYFEMLWDETHRGIDDYRQGAITNMDLYVGERYRRPIVSNIYHEPIDLFDRHLYEKGSLVLHALRGVLGDDAFFRSLQRYCRDNQERSVVTQDLVTAIEAETGRNLEWFFDQWVYKPGHPVFKVSWAWDEPTKVASVSVKQTQDTSTGAPAIFRAPVTIDFKTGRGKPRPFRVEVTEREQTFAFALPAKPDLCRFDPYNWTPKEIEFDKSVGELRLQLRDDDDIAGRQAAATALGKKGGAEATAALEAAVQGDRFWAVQAAAAKALGAMRTVAARDALLSQIGARHPKARRAVVAALGECRGDREVFAALQPLAKRDQSYFVEGEALRSMGKLRLPEAFDVLVANIDRPAFRQAIRIGCIDGLVELRDERAMEVVAAAAVYGKPAFARRFAVAALGRMGEHLPDFGQDLAEKAADFLHDPDFRVRAAAANALKALKDPSYAGQLEDMARRELDGRAVRVAREAAATLRKGADVPSELKSLRDEFERLRDENARLKERLEKVEAR